MQQELTHNL